MLLVCGCSHPDKNQDDPEHASEQFKHLTRAYQCLLTGQDIQEATPDAEQAWEDLDLCQILTEDFFAEAFASELSSFELMYM